MQPQGQLSEETEMSAVWFLQLGQHQVKENNQGKQIICVMKFGSNEKESPKHCWKCFSLSYELQPKGQC